MVGGVSHYTQTLRRDSMGKKKKAVEGIMSVAFEPLKKYIKRKKK